jgi:hypothetical protein
MHIQLPHNLDETWWISNSHIDGYNMETSSEKRKVQKWPLYTRQLVQTILRIKF